MQTNTSKKGFTLIELLIVITIIGILAVALLPSVLGAPARARDAARKADLNNIILALEAFNSDNQHYPSGGGCVDALTDTSLAGEASVLSSYFQGSSTPKDPQGKQALSCASATGYVYCPLSSNNASYLVAAAMEIPGDSNSSDSDFSGFDCGTSVAPPATFTKGGELFVIVK